MNCRDFAVIFAIFTKVCRVFTIFCRDFLLSLIISVSTVNAKWNVCSVVRVGPKWLS